MSDVVYSGGETVQSAAAKEFMSLVEDGTPPTEAAAQVGMTLNELKRSGSLGRAVKETLERAKAEKLLAKDTEDQVARVRRLELMLQDEDLKVAATMVKSTLDVKPNVAVQINNNALLADPAVRESLQSLQIEIEGEEQK
jgi:predicted Zn-dependent protease